MHYSQLYMYEYIFLWIQCTTEFQVISLVYECIKNDVVSLTQLLAHVKGRHDNILM